MAIQGVTVRSYLHVLFVVLIELYSLHNYRPAALSNNDILLSAFCKNMFFVDSSTRIPFKLS
jgi:hypothetical protein